MLEVRSLAIPDVKIVRSKHFSDTRDYFCETFRRSAFAENGISHDFIQDNQSCSERAGTVRGVHFQRSPFAQAKLIRVLRGAILDVVVDLRRWSRTFGKHVSIKVDSESDEQLLVPKGFAHRFCMLEPQATVFYKVDEVYSPDHDGGRSRIGDRLADEDLRGPTLTERSSASRIRPACFHVRIEDVSCVSW